MDIHSHCYCATRKYQNVLQSLEMNDARSTSSLQTSPSLSRSQWRDSYSVHSSFVYLNQRSPKKRAHQIERVCSPFERVYLWWPVSSCCWPVEVTLFVPFVIDSLKSWMWVILLISMWNYMWTVDTVKLVFIG